MIDEIYKNAFKEVNIILENTEKDLYNKIPLKFMDFIKNNMNENYTANIDLNKNIDTQKLLPETEAILSLIYRSYWANSEEKKQFNINDKIYLENLENEKKKKYKDINQIFEERKNLNNIKLDNELAVISKDGFFTKLIKKIKSFFHII